MGTLTPSVHDNTQYECMSCGHILDIPEEEITHPPCPECGGTHLEQIQVTKVCDFCSNPAKDGWCYPCSDFLLMTVGKTDQMSKGDWFACDECHELIEGGDWGAVAEHAVAAHPDHSQTPRDERRALARHLSGLYKRFAKARRGPAYRETEDELLQRLIDGQRRASRFG